MSAEDYEWIANYWSQPSFTLGAQGSFYPDAQSQNAGQSSAPGYDGQMDLDPIALAQTALESSTTYRPQNAYPYISPYGSFFPPAAIPVQPQQQQQRPQSAVPTGFRRSHPSTMPSQAPMTAMSHPTPHTQSTFARPAPAPVPAPTPAPQLPAAQRPSAPPKPHIPQASNPNNDVKRRRVDAGSQVKGTNGHDLSGYSYQPRHPTDGSFLRDRSEIVQPFDKKDAAEKTSYDPKTIARDILVAAGRHPTDPALNHHLFRLRDVFNLVDSTADLETFRWDIVDAPNMQARPTKPAITSKPMPPQAPTQPLTANGHQQSPANHSAATPRPPPATPPLDQTQPIAATARPTPPSRPPRVSIPPASQQQQQQKKQQQQKQPQHRPQAPASVPKRSPAPLVQVQPPKPSPGPQKLQAVSLPQLLSSSARSNKSTPSQPPRRPRRPPKKPNEPETMVGKKPAPKVEVSIPLSAPPMSYPVYSCEWQNCQAELHNLGLLRHHLLKSHIPYTITCSWSGCTCNDPMAAAELFNHVKANHLDPIAWKLGDGPSVPQTVDNKTSANSPGTFATTESNQTGSEDSLIFPASYSSIRAFNRVHGNNSQQDKAREILKALQRHKERIGVGLDPGGCQLATPARNERVSNDEEVFELYPEAQDEPARKFEFDIES